MLFGLVRIKVRLQARKHREDEVPKRGVLSDEEARRVDVGVLQGGLLLGGDVLLLRAVPHFLQARSGRQRDVGAGVVHGLVLDEPPLLFVQLRQDGHPRLLKARTRRVSSHVKLAEKSSAFTRPHGELRRFYKLSDERLCSSVMEITIWMVLRFLKIQRKVDSWLCCVR